MIFQIIKRETCPVVKWKNGAGWTTNLLAYPPAAGIDNFDWRVSLAKLEFKATYSVFAGIDRIQILLNGRGLRLKCEGETHALQPHQSLAFSGDALLQAEPDGCCEALNIMVRRGIYRVTHEIFNADFKTQLNHADYVMYVVEGLFSLRMPDGNISQLGAGDLLHIQHDGYMLQTTATANAVIVAIQFSMVQEHHAS